MPKVESRCVYIVDYNKTKDCHILSPSFSSYLLCNLLSSATNFYQIEHARSKYHEQVQFLVVQLTGIQHLFL